MPFFSEYSALITLAGHVVFAVVYLAYFQSLTSGLRHRKRANIIIDRASGTPENSDLMIGNMGREPIYVSAVFAEARDGSRTHRIKLTDGNLLLRGDDAPARPQDDDLAGTSYGPLDAAQTRSVGSLEEMTERVLEDPGSPFAAEDVSDLTVTVVAESSHDLYLVAAQQSFGVHRDNGRPIYVPRSNHTRQMRSRRERARIDRWLSDALREEAQRFGAISARSLAGSRPSRA